ncbi:unnamed protein product, partial [Mesorhabditis belari]|uniref:Uncharacterized protein n=1 Tax=Mesorhabditis belari TaxID=2138241 RepID=A0AAF3FIY2_9BILA
MGVMAFSLFITILLLFHQTSSSIQQSDQFDQFTSPNDRAEIPSRDRRTLKDIHLGFEGAEVAECSENGLPMKVKHIYYWPGDNISFTCKVCQPDFHSNRKIKMWGWAAYIYDFFDHYQKNKKLQLADVGVQFLQLNSEINTRPNEFYGSENCGPSYMPGNRDQATGNGSLPHIRRQTFEQIGNTLHIHNAEARAAGVYFCYDDAALHLVRYFYILHAMTPINRVNWMDDANLKNRVPLSPDMGKMVSESPDKKASLAPSFQCGNACGKRIYMYPDTQWKFNWHPIIYKRENEPICDSGDLECEQYLKVHPDTDDLVIRKVPETPIHLYVLKRWAIEKRFYTGVALAFQWEPWSKCDLGKTHQRREGHCVLQLVDGKKETNSLLNTHFEASRWMSRLDSIFRLSGGKNTTFVRLHSSTLMTMIMGQPVKTDYGPRECWGSVRKIDNFYEEVIFPSLDIPGEQFNRKKFTLNNEWRACFKYKHSGEKQGNGSYSDIVGTYVIETKMCP